MSQYPVVPDYDQDLQFGSLDDAINTYISTRDDLDFTRKAYNQYEAKAKNYMARISNYIKDKADELGLDSVKGKSGTAYRTVKVQYRMANWDEYWAWCIEHGYSHTVEKRAAKLAVAEIHEATGEVPPGLEYHAEVQFDVRRPSK